ncbi:hypothetical protein PVL29_002815 [Vitis rotundifolia]|uniref:Pentatricopeptide repeat-containing protein n=1 Tax=Vitis rotundifolia TaxID=103349 RepID=A0AA39ACB8_VITRO|nr:hypothetical protein PVL29_002815 [Vitis rotundifolia]
MLRNTKSMIFKKNMKTPLAILQLYSIHTSTQCYPHGRDTINYSKLLSGYLKSGDIKNAEKLFEEIPKRDVVSWSIMIHGYNRNGFRRKSIELFSQMRISSLVPTSFTMVGVLVSIAGLGDPVLGQCVHGLILKYGLDSDFRVVTALLNAYAKCGNVVDSYRVFEQLENPGLVSCSAIVSGFVYNELFEEAVVLFNQFRKLGMVPNAATVLTLIRACVALESRRLCESIHGMVVKLSLVLDVAVNNSVLDMYSSMLDLDAATRVFEGMECRDVISWTTMINLLVCLEYASDALMLFRQMRNTGISNDVVVVMNLISACAILGDLKRGREIHTQAFVRGFGSELPLTNSIIAMYSKCGDLDSSRTVFGETTGKSLVSWTAMILGCVQNGCPREALKLFIKMRGEESFYLDSVMLIGVLSASGELALLELCQQLHCYAFESGFPRYRLVQNSLISAYSKCGDVEPAYNVFGQMGYIRDIVSWNAILNGYGINGHGEIAVTLYHEMRKGQENPDAATYLCVLSACSHSGLVDDGLVIFNQMVEERTIRPSQDHCGCIVDLLARAGCFSDASEFVSRYMEKMGPNAWRALLSGCQLHGNVGLAELAARRVYELDPEEPGQVVLLSNVYASVGRFQDAEALRASMKKKELIKNPGISLLNRIPYDVG